MIIIENGEIYSDSGMFIHRLNTEQYFKRGATISGDTVEFFEEVYNTPNTELDDAITKKLEELYTYDSSSNVNIFYLEGIPMWLDKDTRVGLMNSISIEKALGKTATILWYDTYSFTIPIEVAINMLLLLEMYALQCYNQTAVHAQNIKLCKTIDAVNQYDFTTGYPLKLELKILQS